MITTKDTGVIAAYFFCCISAIFAIAAGLYVLALVPILSACMLYLFERQAEVAQRRVWEAVGEVRREKDAEIADIYEHYDKALLALERLMDAVEADENPRGVGLVYAVGKAREMYNELTQ